MLKNISALSRSGYLYGVNQNFSPTNAFVFLSIEGTEIYKKEVIIHCYQYLKIPTLL